MAALSPGEENTCLADEYEGSMCADFVFCGIESRSLCQWDVCGHRGAFSSSVHPLLKCSHSHTQECVS